MYACNHFDQNQITTWENKDEAINNDWTMVKQYLEGLVRDFEVYKQNSVGTAGKSSTKVLIMPLKPQKATNYASTLLKSPRRPSP